MNWNSHQRRLRALRELQHFERRAWLTRLRRTPREKQANTRARRCWIYAYTQLERMASALICS